MKKLKNFIDDQLAYFQDMGGEVEQISASEFDDDVIEFLKQNGRFDYKGICVYYESGDDEVWIENMED